MEKLTGSARAHAVQDIFTRIAPRYDLMNKVMTGGFDRRRGARAPVRSTAVDRVDWLASTGKAVRAEVLGRAIAHEIGHQLLGSNDHTPRGLMRETWTAEELTRNRAEDWQFSTSQRVALHARWASWGLARRAANRDPRSAFGS